MRANLMVVLCASAAILGHTAEGAAVPECGNMLAALSPTQWRTTTIPVCWENMEPQDAGDREITREAVHRTWEQNSRLHFVGWDKCLPGARGIRIQVEDGVEPPRTYGLGSQLDGRIAGMRLNFQFSSWSETCKQRRESCISVIAVHEFGHALGFTHEQNRPDAAAWCKADVQGTAPDALITSYDPDSVMNYCSPRWGNEGVLTVKDTEGLHVWYGRPEISSSRYAGHWKATLSYSDPGCQQDEMELTVTEGVMTGKAVTPQGLAIPIRAKIDLESDIQGLAFDFGPKDHVTLTGLFPRVLVKSTDCGCGATTFNRVGD